MINVADIHNTRDVTDIIEINVDDHRYVAIGKSRDSFWIVVGQRTLMQKSLVISRDSGEALFQLLGEHLGYIDSAALRDTSEEDNEQTTSVDNPEGG